MKTGKEDISQHKRIIRSVAIYLKNKGFDEIKANTKDYHTPKKIRWDDNDEGVIPDVVAKAKNATYIFDIETYPETCQEEIADRWRLLSVYAARKGGKFYLIVPEEKTTQTNHFLKEIKVKADILKLKGIN